MLKVLISGNGCRYKNMIKELMNEKGDDVYGNNIVNSNDLLR